MACAAESAAATEPVYFTDTYLFTYDDASVVKVDKLAEADQYAVITDKTIMHPQGGGQPSDCGDISCTIAGNDVLFQVKQVSKVKDSSEIQHIGSFASGSESNLCPGQKVRMRINEDVRRLHARLHSAGHLLDAAMVRLNVTGLVPSKGYHFADGPYVEYIGNVANEEREEMIARLNEVIAQLITENIATQVSTGQSGERIVNVAGCPCPCGGTHVKSTAEIKSMKVTRMKKNKKNTKVSYNLNED